MGKNLKIYGITLLVFFLVDIVWLAFISTKLYEDQIGFLLANDVNWIAAGVFYLLYIAGLLFFVILPALEKNSWTHALFAGGFFGLITYATYDFFTVVDLMWEIYLNATTAVITFYVVGKMNK